MVTVQNTQLPVGLQARYGSLLSRSPRCGRAPHQLLLLGLRLLVGLLCVHYSAAMHTSTLAFSTEGDIAAGLMHDARRSPCPARSHTCAPMRTHRKQRCMVVRLGLALRSVKRPCLADSRSVSSILMPRRAWAEVHQLHTVPGVYMAHRRACTFPCRFTAVQVLQVGNNERVACVQRPLPTQLLQRNGPAAHTTRRHAHACVGIHALSLPLPQRDAQRVQWTGTASYVGQSGKPAHTAVVVEVVVLGQS